MGDKDDKTEDATEHKRKKAREDEGNILQSKEIVTTVSIAAIFICLAVFARGMLGKLMYSVEYWFDRLNVAGAVDDVDTAFMIKIALDVITQSLSIMVPIFIFSLLFPVLTVIAQTRGFFSFKPLIKKFNIGELLKKFDPVAGMKRLFGPSALVNLLKGAAELSVILLILYNTLGGKIGSIMRLSEIEMMPAIKFVGDTVFGIAMAVVMAFVFISGVDLLYQWQKREKDLKMTKQEVKDEFKQQEGDPKIKAKIREKQREMSQRAMMDKVPDADVVVKNPTTYAVALMYKPETMAAPVVIARGYKYLAVKIVEIAEKNDIMTIENREVARRLYSDVPVGNAIPAEMYHVVAEIFATLVEYRKKLAGKFGVGGK